MNHEDKPDKERIAELKKIVNEQTDQIKALTDEKRELIDSMNLLVAENEDLHNEVGHDGFLDF